MLQGSHTALVTPFKNKQVDYIAFKNLIEFQLENATDGLVLCGTTGETPALSDKEWQEIVYFGVTHVKKRVPVTVGCGSNNLDKSIGNIKKAADLGADYALCVTPYYNKATQNGLYNFFKEMADNSPLPIILYNIPGRSGVNMNASTTLRLAHDCKNIVAVKEASNSMETVTEIVLHAPANFSVLSGEDVLTLPILACGGRGVISVTANILPKKMHLLVESALNGDFSKAKELHLALYDINMRLFLEVNPAPVKEALALMGKIEREMRPPMYNLAEDNLILLKEALKEHALI